MVCVDTSFIIALLRQNPDALKKLQELRNNKTELYTTAITVAELYHGVYKIKDSQNEETKVRSMLSLMKNIFPVSVDAGKKWGELKNKSSLCRLSNIDLDLLIASIALVENQSEILTKNIKYFSLVPGITTQNW